MDYELGEKLLDERREEHQKDLLKKREQYRWEAKRDSVLCWGAFAAVCIYGLGSVWLNSSRASSDNTKEDPQPAPIVENAPALNPPGR